MDAELKLLLEQLISAIQSTNHTDWWMWGITAFSVVTSMVLSVLLWQTTKRLGKRQNRLEEYKIYKELYSVVFKIDGFTKQLINNATATFPFIQDEESKARIRLLNQEAESLSNLLKDSEVDFRLLLPYREIATFARLNLLLTLAKNIVFTLSLFSDGNICKIENLKYPTKEDIDAMYDNDSEKFRRNIIARIIELNKLPSLGFVDTLDKFIRVRQETFNGKDNILELISSESKVQM